jgi:hypothetical protein
MSDLIKFIQEADVAALQMEQAKGTVETAKQALETAKDNLDQARRFFDELLVRADELGIPRPKVRKLIEERTLALVASGLVDAEPRLQAVKPARTGPKAPRKNSKANAEQETDLEAQAERGEIEFDDQSPVENTLAL